MVATLYSHANNLVGYVVNMSSAPTPPSVKYSRPWAAWNAMISRADSRPAATTGSAPMADDDVVGEVLVVEEEVVMVPEV